MASLGCHEKPQSLAVFLCIKIQRLFWSVVTMNAKYMSDKIILTKFVNIFERRLRMKNKSKKTTNAIMWISMVTVALSFFLVQFHRNTPSVMRDELIDAFSMNATSFGLFSSMYFYPYMLAQIPVGMLLDSVGPRRTIGFCSALAAAGALIFGVSTSYPMACIGRVLIGAGVAAPVISTQKFLINWIGAGKTASYYGIFSFCGKLGGMFAQLPLAWLVAHLDWRAVFFITASISLFIAALCLFVVRDSEEETLSGKKVAEGTKQSFVDLISAMGHVFSNKYVWGMMGVMFIHQALYGLFSSTWAVPYLQDVFGMDKIQASAYTTCMLVGAMLFTLIIGPISDRIKKRKTVVAGVSIIMVIVWGLLAFSGEVLMRTNLLWGVMFLMGATSASVQIIFAYSREINNPKFVGIAVSSINMVGMLGNALSPTVFGALLEHYSVSYSGGDLYKMVFIPCIVLSVVSLILTLLSRETDCQNCYADITLESKKVHSVVYQHN